MPGELYSPADLAAMFSDEDTPVSERRVRDWIRQHGWPHIEVGRTIRFTDQHLEQILAKHTVTPKVKQVEAPVFIDGQTKRSAGRNRP